MSKRRVYTRNRVFEELHNHAKYGIIFNDMDHALRVIKAGYEHINDNDTVILAMIAEVNESKQIVKIPSLHSVMEKLNSK